jgi:hypothetical protein
LAALPLLVFAAPFLAAVPAAPALEAVVDLAAVDLLDDVLAAPDAVFDAAPVVRLAAAGLAVEDFAAVDLALVRLAVGLLVLDPVDRACGISAPSEALKWSLMVWRRMAALCVGPYTQRQLDGI